MTDPYQVLGIDYNADEKQIKTAYKEMVKKYHPDRFHSPEEVQLATQKMTDINSAYDQIMDDRRKGVSPQSYARRAYNSNRTAAHGSKFRRYSAADYNNYANYSNYANAGGFSGTDYPRIRNIISAGDLGTAENMLNAVPQQMRTAEWYFLKGIICQRRGWLNESYHFIRTATQMDPAHPEYQRVFSEMNRSRSGYMTGNSSGNAADCCGTICDIMFCNFCCDCMGGGI